MCILFYIQKVRLFLGHTVYTPSGQRKIGPQIFTQQKQNNSVRDLRLPKFWKYFTKTKKLFNGILW